MTITLYGQLVEVERVRTMIFDLDGLQVERCSDPTMVADGSERVRVYMSVQL